MKIGEIEIIDNFLEEESFEIVKQILDKDIVWVYNEILPYEGDDRLLADQTYNYQYVHSVIHNNEIESGFYHALKQSGVFKKLKVRALCRVKFNSICREEKIITHGFHQDMYFDGWPDGVDGLKTSILYINTNDGFTVFEDGTKVKSIANRVVTFPVSYRHSGTTCTNCPRRVALNVVYF